MDSAPHGRSSLHAAAALAPVTLVLGGARSGKSAFAEQLIANHPGARVYLATAVAGDDEMRARIAEHRRRRDPAWRTVEEPYELAEALVSAASGAAVLVDCLTLWLSNLLLAKRDAKAAVAALLETLPRLDSPVVFVGNEVGAGIVPDNPLARAFRDEAGWLNQRAAAAASRVYLVTAGLPLMLKDETK